MVLRGRTGVVWSSTRAPLRPGVDLATVSSPLPEGEHLLLGGLSLEMENLLRNGCKTPLNRHFSTEAF